jgi:hypothetical protein
MVHIMAASLLASLLEQCQPSDVRLQKEKEREIERGDP